MTAETAQVAMEFRAFPKIARLNRECVITEKIDGTNACVVIGEDGEVGSQSRNRNITHTGDSFGFSLWVERHKDQLRDLLGPGYHYGEWWGPGIQRGYATSKEEANTMGKRLSLFNVARWEGIEETSGGLLRTVPVLYRGLFSTEAVSTAVERLRTLGSVAAPGFMKPEGVVVFHVAANVGFKVTLEKDEEPKGRPTTQGEGE